MTTEFGTKQHVQLREEILDILAEHTDAITWAYPEAPEDFADTVIEEYEL